MMHIDQDGQHASLEHPCKSATLEDYPIKTTAKSAPFSGHTRKTAMGAFNILPDGKRHRKSAKVTPTFSLTKSYRRYICKLGHAKLFGYDSEQHRLRTAAAASYPTNDCRAYWSDAADAADLCRTARRKTQLLNAAPASAVHGASCSYPVVSRGSEAPSSLREMKLGGSPTILSDGIGKLLHSIDGHVLRACLMTLMDGVAACSVSGDKSLGVRVFDEHNNTYTIY